MSHLLKNCVWCGFWILEENEASQDFCDCTCLKCAEELKIRYYGLPSAVLEESL